MTVQIERPQAGDRERFRTCNYYDGTGHIDTDPARGRISVESHLRVRSDVQLAWQVFDPECSALADIYSSLGRCTAVIDEEVHRLHGQRITAYFAGHGIALHVMTCRAREADKTFGMVQRIAAFLGSLEVNRSEPVLVVGGGVLTDTAGLACSLLHRRTPYVMVATSLVAAIDAGPSPRTCVNVGTHKNFLGTYHPPVLTLVDRSLFATLAEPDFRHGLAEVLKMAIVDDFELFDLLDSHGGDLVAARLARPGSVDDAIVFRTLRSYLRHEGPNLFEVFQDRPHAYGHTWSPGFELAAGLRHGHAVSVEIAFSATLAALLGWLTSAERDRILDVCQKLGLAIHHPAITDVDMLVRAQQAMLAKRGGGGLWAPLPRGIGGCGYVPDVSLSLLRSAIGAHSALCETRSGCDGQDMYTR
ncbi:3-dehydroquinate synthase [Sinosporangium album]|uniref:2-epi-5-epi-valiolone synthase n=1 Tax=Sinosporangium album TaxID=504805 RepID=A0A1G7ZMZ3_9ACTN|nr:sedoheptulose 7-phosphate cyclase [Sinosporangium album]SDH09470.1 3-dehydroquinate synthase [Sinosporangium album]